MRILFNRIILSIITALFLLLISVPVSAHNLPIGGSRWCFGKNTIVANIDFGPSLLAEIREIKDGHYDLDSISDEQLRRITSDILQPYMDKKLSLTVNGKTCPVKADKTVRNGNMYTLWLSADDINFRNPSNQVKIEYRLLFDETSNAHVNLAYGYLSDATGDALQKVFDFSPPAMQNTFDYKSPPWEFSVNGPAPVPAEEHKTGNPIIGSGPDSIKKSTAKDSSAAARLTDREPTAAALPQKTAAISERAQNNRGPGNPGASLKTVTNESKKDALVPDKPAGKPLWSTIGQFLLLGIEHILTGYDHMAFLLVLIVIGMSIKEVLKIITAFTVAHSITLLLAALQIISLNSRLVETVIAFSICFVALENLFKKKADYRWLVTFGFGLVHGFGFASVLQELVVGKSNLLVSVVSFNMGVELGQIMIFLVLLPMLHLLKNRIEFRKVTIGVSLAVFLLGFTWLLERSFNLKLLPI